MPEPPTVTGDPAAQYLRARAVKTSFEARTAQLEYEERAGSRVRFAQHQRGDGPNALM